MKLARSIRHEVIDGSLNMYLRMVRRKDCVCTLALALSWLLDLARYACACHGIDRLLSHRIVAELAVTTHQLPVSDLILCILPQPLDLTRLEIKRIKFPLRITWTHQQVSAHLRRIILGKHVWTNLTT